MDPSDYPDDDPADVFGDRSVEDDGSQDEDEADPPIDPETLLAHMQAELGGRPALRLLASLADEFGCLVEDIQTAAAPLVSEGHLEAWPENPGGPALMLSAFTAKVLSVRLEFVLRGDGGRDEWVPADQKKRAWRAKAGTETLTETDLTAGMYGQPRNLLDHLPDPKAENPESQAIEAERPKPASIIPGYLRNPPRPVILLGSSLPWPLPILSTGCAACSRWRSLARPGDWRKPIPVACIYCGWYSHDHLLPTLAEIEREMRSRKTHAPDGRGLKGGIGA